MAAVTTVQLARACRTFMALAYPGGAATIPEKKRIYFDLPVERPVSDFLPPAPAPEGIVQALPADGSTCASACGGWALRLGSAHFPHLKLKVQFLKNDGCPVCVFMVDTHDAFSRTSAQPPPDHPDAAAWLELQSANRQLKENIERAFEAEGLTTFQSLLRSDLPKGKS